MSLGYQLASTGTMVDVLKSNDPDFDQTIRIISIHVKEHCLKIMMPMVMVGELVVVTVMITIQMYIPEPLKIQDTIDNNCNGENNEENYLDVE